MKKCVTETPVVVCHFSCLFAFGLQIHSMNAFYAFCPLNIFSVSFLYDTLFL